VVAGAFAGAQAGGAVGEGRPGGEARVIELNEFGDDLRVQSATDGEGFAADRAAEMLFHIETKACQVMLRLSSGFRQFGLNQMRSRRQLSRRDSLGCIVEYPPVAFQASTSQPGKS